MTSERQLHTVQQKQLPHYAYQAHQRLEQRAPPSDSAQLSLQLELLFHGQSQVIHATGLGIHEALYRTFQSQGIELQIFSHSEEKLRQNPESKVLCILEIRVNGAREFDVAMADTSKAASIQATINAINRQQRQRQEETIL